MLPPLHYGHRRPYYPRTHRYTSHKNTMNDNSNPFLGQYDPSQLHTTASTTASSHPSQYCDPMVPQDPNGLVFNQFESTGPFQQSPSGYSLDFEMGPGIQPPTLFPDNQLPETENERAKRKRQEQNRRSQKEFRMRKEKRIKELQADLEKAQSNLQSVSQEAGELRSNQQQLEAEIERLIEENRRLRSSMESSPASEASFFSNLGEGGHSGPSKSLNKGSGDRSQR